MTETISTLFSFLREIKTPAFQTNAVFTADSLKLLVETRGAEIIIGENAAVILEPDSQNILRLYFYAKDVTALGSLAGLIPLTNREIVCDVVGREPKVGYLSHKLEEVGFSFYAKFQRMLCKEIKPDTALDLSAVEIAEQEDALEILELTQTIFDPLTAHIGSFDKLVQRIKDEEVFLIRRDRRIAGFASFESKNKQVALLDHILVRPEYQGQKIAKRLLMYKWLHKNESSHYILWVNELSAGPISFHMKNGFCCDGMYDYILTI